ncbi:hypothetical protein ACFWPX_23305 [Nocardia sp. NPDC058518]|uniref:hypothetical protein n=1 Tax=Nocardia sp. NPDC058518 TaxID=3346534 RepID=UPI00364758E3
MKRVLVGASILAAFMTTATGMAAADAQPSHRVPGVEIAGADGSTENLSVLLWRLGLGSSNPACDNPMFCPGLPAANAPIADSGSALMTPETVLAINHALAWLYNGSSEPCVSFGPNCAWE